MKHKRNAVLVSACFLFLLHLLFDAYIPSSAFPCEPDQRFAGTDWYKIYANSVRSVRKPGPCTECDNATFTSFGYACARWWHPTPYRHYYNPPTQRNWSAVLLPKDHVTPPCEFGQLKVKETRCSDKQRSLFKALDKLRVVYYARAGTELGIVRGSEYIGSDGDIDLFIDMPPEMLYEHLRSSLRPAPVLNRKSKTVKDPWVQWMVGGCPTVNTAYTDWISDELRQKAQPADLCRCRLNSVDLMCHVKATERMYALYGPSWDLELPLKSMDKPDWPVVYRDKLASWGWEAGMAEQITGLVNQTTGRIEAEKVNALAGKQLGEEKLALVLAQLNTYAARLDDAGITSKRKVSTESNRNHLINGTSRKGPLRLPFQRTKHRN